MYICLLFVLKMTAGEIKFALQVEAILNKITQPEYRQLMVEAIMILCLIVEHDGGRCRWNEMIVVDKLVHHANDIFVKEQVTVAASVDLGHISVFFYLNHQSADLQLVLTGWLYLDGFPNKILTDGQLTEG